MQQRSLKAWQHWLARSGLVSLLLSAPIGSAQGQETPILCEKVPAAVRAAFEKAYPLATAKACSREVDAGKVAYEISSLEGVTYRDIIFSPAGKLMIVEEAIAFDSTPEPVRQAVGKRIPDGTITLVEKITHEDGTILYEFRVKHGSRTTELTFDPTGREVKP